MKQRSKKKPAIALKRRSATKSMPAKFRAPALARLKQKYGAKAIDGLARVRPEHIAEHVDWCDGLDQHFTKLWLDFIYAGMYTRGILDDRTRILCVIGELTDTQLPLP